jgi:hypothetical protein
VFDPFIKYNGLEMAYYFGSGAFYAVGLMSINQREEVLRFLPGSEMSKPQGVQVGTLIRMNEVN